ncbi:efflux RND transporter permease subunit [candidate division KSB1 bacterium]|nr:efflux RND transporter permease subunit [candidate division KSB1 bacterium]
MNISELSVSRPVTVLVLTAVLMIMAIFLVPNLSVEMFPETTFPIVAVVTTYSGASAEEVEDSVTIKIEKQLSNVENLKQISSSSSEGRSQVSLEFSYGTDLDEAINDIRDNLERIRNSLPDDADSTQIMKFDPSSEAIMTLIVKGDDSPEHLKTIAEDDIVPRLERIQGVASAEVTGGVEKAVRVDLSLNRLEAFKLTVSSVQAAIAGADTVQGTGDIVQNGMEYNLRINQSFGSLEDIRNTVVAVRSDSNDGSLQPIYLSDIADVYLGEAERDSIVEINNEEAVLISIVKESDSNSVKIAEHVRTELFSINDGIEKNITIEILYDNTTMISSIMNQVYTSAIQGALLAMIILFLFLRNVRSTLIIGISIPVSILTTLLCMHFFDVTLNMISLTGLILGLGMTVDNSIVILESIFSYRERGVKIKPAAILGSHEMINAIVSSTLTTLCVFIPMIIWKNELEMLGQIFQDMIFTIVISLVASLVVALTLVPALSSSYLKIHTARQKTVKNRVLKKIDSLMERSFRTMETSYKKSLHFALSNRFLILTLTALLLVFSLIQLTQMGVRFQPSSNADDQIQISITMPVGTHVSKTEEVLRSISNEVEATIKGYTNIVLRAGTGGMRSTASGYRGSLTILLPDTKDQVDTPASIQEKLRPFLQRLPDVEFEFSSGRHFGSGDAIDIEISSDDINLATKTAGDIKSLLSTDIPGIVDPSSSMEEGYPEYRIKIDTKRALSMGVESSQIGAVLSSLLNGTTPATYWHNGEEIDVILKLQENDRKSLTEINSISILNSSGDYVSLSNFVSYELAEGPLSIEREDETRIVHVTADIEDTVQINIVNAQIQNLLDIGYIIPDGVSINISGEQTDIQDLTGPLLIIAITALILVFGIMASLFESFADPFIIFFSIPLMLIGVVLVYKLTADTLSLFSIVGMVVLMGIVVNNGIVLVDYTNLLVKRGAKVKDACLEAGTSRLRPVLMTSLTTILGMVPLGFFPGEGAETIQAIGKTIVGGLSMSSIMTLFVTPVLYSLINRKKKQAEETVEDESAIYERMSIHDRTLIGMGNLEEI